MGMDKFMEEMNQIVDCKYCGKPVMWGELTWLEGKCMCPSCYKQLREQKDKEAAELENE